MIVVSYNSITPTESQQMKPMLAKPYADQNPTGWLISEKLDGVRALWDGATLTSRNGNTFFAPAWFLAQLPAGTALDGELYIGRGKFQDTVGIVRTHVADDAAWARITFMVFDAPAVAGGFEARLAAAATALAGSTVAQVVAHTACTGAAHLDAVFAELVALGAEGLMLRKPGSAYDQKRSANLLKYKPFESDEAVVIGHETGAGRLAGVIGALVCQWKDKIFRVGTGLSDAARIDPPSIGALVSFGFCGVTDGGVPRFPTFLAVRDYE